MYCVVFVVGVVATAKSFTSERRSVRSKAKTLPTQVFVLNLFHISIGEGVLAKVEACAKQSINENK